MERVALKEFSCVGSLGNIRVTNSKSGTVTVIGHLSLNLRRQLENDLSNRNHTISQNFSDLS